MEFLRNWYDRHSGAVHRALPTGARIYSFCRLVAQEFGRPVVQDQSHALTSMSLLAAVPALSLVAAVVAGFGGKEYFQTEIQPRLLASLAPGTSASLGPQLASMVERVNIQSLGFIGLLGVLWTVMRTMDRLESTFCKIMRIEVRRSIFERVVITWSMLTLSPLILGATLTAQAQVLSRPELAALPHGIVMELISGFAYGVVLPILVSSVVFAALYVVIPPVAVQVGPALVGGGVAALLWEAAKRTYYGTLLGSFQLNTIYGTLVAIPVTIIWLQVTWMIVLLGAVVAYVLQEGGRLELSRSGVAALPEQMKVLAVMVAVSRDFLSGARGSSSEAIQRGAGLGPLEVDQALATLRDAGLIAATAHESWLPTRSPAQVPATDVLALVEGVSLRNLSAPLEKAERRAASEYLRAWEGFTVADLIERDSRANPANPNPAAPPAEEKK